jgi:hypothetical protein
MSRKDDRRDNKLPVTAEVGGEGGSCADPTIQVPTFHEDLPSTDEPVNDTTVPADAEPAPRVRRDVNE